jgi:hypothetical protein
VRDFVYDLFLYSHTKNTKVIHRIVEILIKKRKRGGSEAVF